MKSNIIFFDTHENGMKGTYRALVVIIVILICWFLWYMTAMKNIYKKYIEIDVKVYRIGISIFVCLFLISSSIGVHNPDTIKKAVVYGALVGFVISGVVNSVLLIVNNNWTYGIASIDIIFHIVSISISALVLYKLTEQYPSAYKVI
jgi:uncharacterized membrane protein